MAVDAGYHLATISCRVSGFADRAHIEDLLAPARSVSAHRHRQRAARVADHAADAGANFQAIRGNLDTRLRKLDGGDYDALVLAAAGLRRLGFTSRISLALPVSACVPAPGQGIVAIEIRADDDEVRRAVARIDDPAARRLRWMRNGRSSQPSAAAVRRRSARWRRR